MDSYLSLSLYLYLYLYPQVSSIRYLLDDMAIQFCTVL